MAQNSIDLCEQQLLFLSKISMIGNDYFLKVLVSRIRTFVLHDDPVTSISRASQHLVFSGLAPALLQDTHDIRTIRVVVFAV